MERTRPRASSQPSLGGPTVPNARLSAPEHLTRPLESIAAAEALTVMIDVDVLRRSWSPNGDRLIARALDALAQVGVEVLVVAKAAAIARLGAPPRSFRTIAISDDAQLLAALGPEDRGLTFICEPGSVHGVLPGEISMRAVLWWLVNLRAAAGMARGQT